MKWLVALLAICSALFSSVVAETVTLVQRIHTVAADDQRGIPSHVVLVHQDSNAVNLGTTDANGVFDLSKPISCMRGMILKVTSGSAWYYDATKQMDCENPEYVHLAPIRIRDKFPQAYGNPVIVNIAHNTIVASTAKDYALIALLYNELAVEFYPISIEQYQRYSSRAIDFPDYHSSQA